MSLIEPVILGESEHGGIRYQDKTVATNQILSMIDQINALNAGYAEQARSRSAWSAQDFRTWNDQYFAQITLLSQQVAELILIYKRDFQDPNFPNTILVSTPLSTSVIPTIQPIDVTLNLANLEGSQVTSLLHTDTINITDYINDASNYMTILPPKTTITPIQQTSDLQLQAIIDKPINTQPTIITDSKLLTDDKIISEVKAQINNLPNWVLPVVGFSIGGLVAYVLYKKNKKSKFQKEHKEKAHKINPLIDLDKRHDQ